MEITLATIISAELAAQEKQIPLPVGAVMIGKLFTVIENDGSAAIAEEVTDAILAARVRLTPEHQVGQKVRFVHFN